MNINDQKKAALLTGILVLFLILRRRPRLAIAINNSRDESYAQATAAPHTYWNMSCPWEMITQSIAYSNDAFFDMPTYKERPFSDTRETFASNARNARDFALHHKAPERFTYNLDALKGRRTVILGDSLCRQLYISMACLIPPEMIQSHSTDWKHENAHFQDARIKVIPSGEVFFAPKAGRLQEYGWFGDDDPINSEDDWIQACREKKPFTFKSLYISHQEHTGTDNMKYREGDQKYEIITLSKNDAVIINAGLHLTTRPQNLMHLQELLDCMDEAYNEGYVDLDWPHIAYSKTSLQHFDNPSGQWEGQLTHRCKKVNENIKYQEEDFMYFENRLPIIGHELNYTDLGNLHVQGFRPDCTHWFQPGLPDVVAAEIVEYLANLV